MSTGVLNAATISEQESMIHVICGFFDKVEGDSKEGI